MNPTSDTPEKETPSERSTRDPEPGYPNRIWRALKGTGKGREVRLTSALSPEHPEYTTAIAHRDLLWWEIVEIVES